MAVLLAVLLGKPLEGRTDPQGSGLEICVRPVEAEDLALPKAEGHPHREQSLQPMPLHAVEERPRLLRRKRCDFVACGAWHVHQRRDVAGHEVPAECPGECDAENRPGVPDRPGRRSRLLMRRQPRLEPLGGELLQLDLADARNEVLLDGVLIRHVGPRSYLEPSAVQPVAKELGDRLSGSFRDHPLLGVAEELLQLVAYFFPRRAVHGLSPPASFAVANVDAAAP